MGRFCKSIKIELPIGTSHLQIPGPFDGRIWRSMLPKDTALVKFASEVGIDLSILKEAIIYNNKVEKIFQ